MISAESLKKWERLGGVGRECAIVSSVPIACLARVRGAADGKPTHSHPLSLCQLQTAEKSLRGLGRGVTTLPVFPKAQHSLPHSKTSTSTLSKSSLRIDSSVHGTMRAAAGCPAVPSRSQPGNGVGVRPTPGARDQEAGALVWVRSARGRPGLHNRHHPSCGGNASRAESQLRSPLRSLSGPPAFPPPAPRAPPTLPGALSCLFCSRLLLSLPPPPLALYPLTFPSPGRRRRAPRQLRAHCRPRTAGEAVFCIPSPRPWRAPERIERCSGLGTEAQPRRDGWALGFWVRQPQLGLLCLPPPPPPHSFPQRRGHWDGLSFGVRHGTSTTATGFLPKRPTRSAVPPEDPARSRPHWPATLAISFSAISGSFSSSFLEMDLGAAARVSRV